MLEYSSSADSAIKRIRNLSVYAIPLTLSAIRCHDLMCLAVPGKIGKINGSVAKVDFGGVVRDVSLDLAPRARIGSYVLVHAGFAIEVLEEKDALETLELFKEIYGEEKDKG